MKLQDIFGSAASGSTGSKTASRNRGGQYLRNRAIPTNPNSARQANVREGLGTLTPQWSSTLTEDQRAAWNLYAANVPVVDVLGATIKLSGINMFVRANAPRLQAGFDVILDAPATFNVGDTPILGSFTMGDDGSYVVGGSVLLPATADDTILVYQGRPTNAGVSYFRGPYRFWGFVAPDAVTGIWSFEPDVADTPFAVVAGQKVFARLQCSREDGRLSADAQGSTIVQVIPP